MNATAAARELRRLGRLLEKWRTTMKNEYTTWWNRGRGRIIAAVAALATLQPMQSTMAQGPTTGRPIDRSGTVKARTGTPASAPSPALLDELKQWKINAPSRPMQILPKASFEGPADRSYTLKNRKVRKFLQHESQVCGINLGWTDDAEPSTANKVRRWFFTRAGGGTGPLVYGEYIAIGNGMDPSFIRYEKRTLGVNLGWSDAPVYEWRLAGGPAGVVVNPDDYLAIYNERAGEFFIFFDRTRCGDMGWPSSQTWGDQITGELLEQVKKAALEALLAAAAG
jgi:hypothetical protein